MPYWMEPTSHHVCLMTSHFNILGWMIVGMIGAFVFILIQLVLLVDFAYAWNDKFLERAEEGNGHRGWYIGKFLMKMHYINDAW